MKLLYPGFLVALGAIAIPIIIHLLQLRKPKRLLFTNTAFIREVELVTVQHRRLQHLLVLGARVLGIVALVLMFCQPFVPAKNVAQANTGGVGVVVDNSFSMQMRGTVQSSLFQEAIVNARNLGAGGKSEKQLELLSAGKATPFGAALDELKLSAQANAAKNLRNHPAQNQVYVISDFQKNGFNTDAFDGLERTRQTVLVPLKGEPTANVYVDSVWVDDAFVRVRTNLSLHVRVRNGGNAELKDCPVKVFLTGKQVAAFRVTLAAGQVLTSVVQVQVSDASVALGRVVTEDVPVTFDNAYYFTLQPAANISVLEIGTAPIAQQLYANEPLFNYTFSKPERVDYGGLRRANVVLVRGLATIDAGLREALRAVTQRGGTVVVVPSTVAGAQASYQQLFRELGLGAARWEAAVATPELRDVAMPNAQDPFFQDVFGAPQRAVTMPRVAPVLRWTRTGKDILRLRDGESYLASFASGTGQVYVFSAPFEKAYSDFGTHALFVPVMYRMAMLSYRNEQLPAYRLTQNGLALKLPVEPNQPARGAERADEAPLRLVKDSLTLIPAQRMVGQEVQLALPESMAEAGFYRVMRRNKVLATLAFNQDKRESELAVYSAEELRQLIGPNRPNIQVLEAGTDGAGLAKFQAEQTGQPLWRYCLLVALACLLAEALLLQFGSRRAVAAGIRQAA
ncbi:BatA domain-containing protein [Hymenobacter antarcticus]|uniref:BatA and WFA domain-containing protein n=1 Tax=Hymenobacter antarcticus TaxID=486270 RepID=A0ABP7QK19_9BACT